jgi:sec-independent protein translocase protein TatB
MFDFSWSQIMLIGVVALVLIGPKDLPIALRAISNLIKKARSMAAEFHTHVDDMMKSADLKDVKDQFGQLRNFDLRSEIEKAVDPDRTIRDTFNANPLDPGTPAATAAAAEPEPPAPTAPVTPPPDPTRAHAPPFIPPALVAPRLDLAQPPDRPAFIPPQIIPPT